MLSRLKEMNSRRPNRVLDTDSERLYLRSDFDLLVFFLHKSNGGVYELESFAEFQFVVVLRPSLPSFLFSCLFSSRTWV